MGVIRLTDKVSCAAVLQPQVESMSLRLNVSDDVANEAAVSQFDVHSFNPYQ